MAATPVLASTAVTRVSTSSDAWLCTAPADVANGDLLVAFFLTTSSGGWSATGWTAGPSFASPFAAGTGSIASMWRIADGSEGSGITFNHDFITGLACLCRVTGADRTTPVHGNSTGGTDAFGANPTTLGSITTTIANCLLLDCWYLIATSNRDMTPVVAGPTKIVDVAPISGDANHLELWTEGFAGPGAIGTKDWNCSNTGARRTCLKLAIAPIVESPRVPRRLNAMQAVQRAAVM